MADPIDVSRIAQQLHEQGIVNLDVTARQLLVQPEGVGLVDPESMARVGVLGVTGYFLVYGGDLKAQSPSDATQVAGSVRQAVSYTGARKK